MEKKIIQILKVENIDELHTLCRSKLNVFKTLIQSKDLLLLCSIVKAYFNKLYICRIKCNIKSVKYLKEL